MFGSLERGFSELPDPRVQGRCDHRLIDLIIITSCAVICGADSWTSVETFAASQADLAETVPRLAEWDSLA